MIKIKKFINETFCEEQCLYDLTNDKVLLKGDYYHDKIDESIEGFVYAMEHFNIEHEYEEDELIGTDNCMFEKIGFANEED